MSDKKCNPTLNRYYKDTGRFVYNSDSGITLTEHFAGLAMQALVLHKDPKDCVKLSIEIADLLASELQKKESK
jgi:hypothetical protein